MGIVYRLRQLGSNLTAGPLSNEAWLEVTSVLTLAERELFGRLSFADQWHSYRVLRTLQNAGYNQPDLSAAALLHDVGKTCYPLNAWDRTLIVVGGALFPDRAAKWGQGSPDGWRRPFVVRAMHPVWGADMVAAAGSRTGVVDLVLRHQDKVGDPKNGKDELLRRLQWADDQN
ncbi:MAG: hypothetical protein DCC51_01720 [Anaerolineae bacterium]|nr:MAG: hypothetical protein DCC51_01720 [Anaerolineae bacterium]